MTWYDYLIIGGGTAGTSAAETIRAADPASSIAIVSDEPHPLYSRILLPAYVKGEIAREQLFLRRSEDYAAKRIDLLRGETAAALDAGRRVVALGSGRELGFGALLIAGGGRPQSLGVRGEGLAGVARFQTIDDAERMRGSLAGTGRAVVVGAGFIALEFLEILKLRGIPAALVFSGRHFFGRHLDEAGGKFIDAKLASTGVDPIRTEETLAAVEGQGRVSAVRTSAGAIMPADFVGAGIGLQRCTAWLAGSGVELSRRGVAADGFLATNVHGIFAAGDIADFKDPLTGRYSLRGNWANATLQGKAAGHNMARPEARQPFEVVPSYGVRGAGLNIGLVGDTIGGEGTESVGRLEPDGEAYARFVFRDGRMVGATLINHPRELRQHLAELIRQAVSFDAPARERLADASVDIASAAP